jgi:hypothetical protein
MFFDNGCVNYRITPLRGHSDYYYSQNGLFVNLPSN